MTSTTAADQADARLGSEVTCVSSFDQAARSRVSRSSRLSSLPRRPVHYDLTIRTDLKDLTFTGTAEITVTVHKPVPHLTLHAASPLVPEAAILGSSQLKTESARPAEHIRVDEKKERVQITFAGGEIQKGEHKIGLRWNATLDGESDLRPRVLLLSCC
jgi:aminopeptidase N